MTTTEITAAEKTGATAPQSAAPGSWLRRPTGVAGATSSPAGTSNPTPSTQIPSRPVRPTMPSPSCEDEAELRREIAAGIREWTLRQVDLANKRLYATATPAEQVMMLAATPADHFLGYVVYKARTGLAEYQEKKAEKAAQAIRDAAQRERTEAWLAQQAAATPGRTFAPLTELGKVTTVDELRQDHDPVEVEARRITLLAEFRQLPDSVQAQVRRNDNWGLLSSEMPPAPSADTKGTRVTEFRDEVERRHNANLWLSSRLPSLVAEAKRLSRRRSHPAPTSAGTTATTEAATVVSTAPAGKAPSAKEERRAREKALRTARMSRIAELQGHPDFSTRVSSEPGDGASETMLVLVSDLRRVSSLSTTRLGEVVDSIEQLLGLTATAPEPAAPAVVVVEEPASEPGPDAYVAEADPRQALIERLAELKQHERYTTAVRPDTRRLADMDPDTWSDDSLGRIVATIEGNLSGKKNKKERKN